MLFGHILSGLRRFMKINKINFQSRVIKQGILFIIIFGEKKHCTVCLRERKFFPNYKKIIHHCFSVIFKRISAEFRQILLAEFCSVYETEIFFRVAAGTEIFFRTVDRTEIFPFFFRSVFFRSAPFPWTIFWRKYFRDGIKNRFPWKH